MQTVTLKEATEQLGVSLDDMVRVHTLGNFAIIHVDLNIPQPNNADHFQPAQLQALMTPEEEFRKKYPQIKVESEFFKLVGSMTAPEGVSDKDLLIEVLEAKYGK